MNDNVKVHTDLGIVKYSAIVKSIADGYFDDEFEFVPHFGKLNAMRLFYNICVEDDILGKPHDISDALEMEDLVNDVEFIRAFMHATEKDDGLSLNFANAYYDAIKIVNTKKGSLNRAVDVIKSVLNNIVNSMGSVFTEENMAKMQKMSEDIASGKLSNESIAEAFGNSATFDKIIKK